MRKGVSFYYFRRKPIVLSSRYERWRGVADLLKLKAHERLRVEWMVFYFTQARENVTITCKHFGISRKTFYKWFNRFRNSKENVESLRDNSRRPYKVRGWEVSLTEEIRIKELRKKYMYYGKKKLKVLYKKGYNEDISCWKIERVIREHKLYPDKAKQAKTAKKQARAREKPKKRIQALKKENRLWFLFQIDTVVIYWDNLKRYIITAVDHTSKLGYARMYKTKSSQVAAGFLYRLNHLIQQPIENIQIDNDGSEFAYYFEKATDKLKIARFYSRVRTPKDNCFNERFNRTLREEFIQLGNYTPFPEIFNKNLTDWLIEYNFNRPHQSLDYLSPVEYLNKYQERLLTPLRDESLIEFKDIFPPSPNFGDGLLSVLFSVTFLNDLTIPLSVTL